MTRDATALFSANVVRSASDYVYNELRRRIYTQQLPEGARLVEAKISKELSVSITPVREAFARLANQGLLTVFPYKGTYVTVVTKEYVRDLYYLRRHLETMAADLGFPHLTDEDIRWYEDIVLESDRAFDQQDLYTSINCDVQFHERLFLICENALLLEMWNLIKNRIEVFQAITKPAMRRRMSERHAKMMEALRARDKDLYVAAMLEHLGSNLHYVDFPDDKDVVYN